MSNSERPPAQPVGIDRSILALAENPCVRVTSALAAATTALVIGGLVWQPGHELLLSSYLPLHSFLEACSIFVAVLVFVVSRRSERGLLNRNMVLLGVACLAAGSLDFLHVLSYPGMPDLVKPSSPSNAIDLPLAARVVAVSALLFAAFASWEQTLPARRAHRWTAGAAVLVAAFSWLFLLRPHGVMDTLASGRTLAIVRVMAELAIIAMSLVAAFGFFRLTRRPQTGRFDSVRFDPVALLAATVVMAMAEALFALYTNVDGLFNVLGHVYKVLGACFVYRGLVAVNLIDAETLSRLALEAAKVGAWSWDVKSDAIECDNATGEIWALSPATAPTGAAFESRVHPDDRGARNAALRQALDPQGNGDYRAEFRIRVTDATGAITQRTIVDLGRTEFKDGRPLRILCISRDVGEDRRTEAAARGLEAKLSLVLSIAADSIISIDADQRIVLINHGAEATFGYAAAQVIGQPLAMLLPERYRVAHDDHVRGFAASPTTARRMGERAEIFALRKSGEEFPAEASISKLEVDGELTFTVVLRDVTRRKADEKALAAANQDLENQVAERTRELHTEMQRREQAQSALATGQRMEAFGQLAGGIAHDFNNLLTVITGNQELLEMRLKDAKDRALLKRANEAAEMGARLTARLLTFARRRRLEPTLLNLNDQIIGMVELLRRSIGEQVTLTTNLAPRLSPVRADPSEIENAVLNLVINARDAMPNGGMLFIEASDCTIDGGEAGREGRLAPGDYVRLSVSDTGTGMTQDVLRRAFEPFFTTKQPGKGTGLGLSTIYGFVQQSGGTVTAYSEVGRGTTINIYLPRVEDAGATAEPRLSPEAVPTGAGETILVVEDNAEVRDVARKRLEGLGYAVLEAESATAAIDLLGAPPVSIALVFSDVVMPGGMSGFDLARWVAANAPGIEVVLTSGYPDEIALAQEDKLPAIRLLRKPYNRAELARAMRDALGK